jgi:type I restriction enzyme S subunit
MGGLVADPERARELAALFPSRLGDDGLPEGWEATPIGQLAEIVGGSTPSTKAEEYWNDGHHVWATPKDLSKLDGLFLFDTERRITDAGLAKIGSGLSPAGTVLLSSRAPIGYLAIADTLMAVNQGFIAIRPSPKLPTSMALFWCQTNMERIKSSANGSTFQEISKGNFRPLTVVSGSRETVTAFDSIAAPMLELIRSRSRETRTLAAKRDLLLPRLMSGEIRLCNTGKVAEVAA